ncbi:MAG: DUF3299 domain-containing protein [Betaproteobacteria bacterium]
MRRCAPLLFLAMLASIPAAGVTTDIPASGLPNATDYSATLLPEKVGVVSWHTLGQVEAVKEGGKMVPAFSSEIKSLDRKDVKVQGFIIPLDMGDKQKRFLISAAPPDCAFCLPAGPEGMVEVLAKSSIRYGFEPIVVSGRFAVLKDDPAGVLYRLTNAELVETAKSAPAKPSAVK